MKQGHRYYVYILECSDKSYYTGVTNNLERRIWEHESGFNPGCYTCKRRPVILKYAIHHTDIKQAIAGPFDRSSPFDRLRVTKAQDNYEK